jgi:hypothetical protein
MLPVLYTVQWLNSKLPINDVNQETGEWWLNSKLPINDVNQETGLMMISSQLLIG